MTERAFRAEHVTEGKIAIDEDRSTPVFSPYAGRVTKLLARPGDSVVKGQPLFVIEAADTVQAQNDYIAAMTGVNKAKSALDLAEIQDKRAKDLFEGKAVPLKDYQQSQATLIQAQNDLRSSQTALEAARNKLRILGFTDDDIAAFRAQGRHQSRDHDFCADRRHRGAAQGRPRPICQFRRQRSGLCHRRSLHRLAARPSCARATPPRSAVGQEISFSVMALPGRSLTARINYVAAAIDPATRRLLVRATIDNKDGA